MENTIHAKDILRVLKERSILILMIIVLAVVSSWAITKYFVTPTYQASTQLLVNQSPQDQLIDVNQVRTNIELINTYNVIIKNPMILSEVAEKLNLDLSISELGEQISVTSLENSQVMEILVESYDPAVAASIANETAKVFQREIANIMKVDNVNILYEALEEPNPVGPNMLMNVGVAFVLGLCCGVGLAFLLEYLNTSIKSEKDIEEFVGIPVVGHIPTIKVNHKEEKNKVVNNQVEMGGRTLES